MNQNKNENSNKSNETDTENNKKELDFKAELKEKFLEWCEYCTTHGIPNIARNQSKLVRLVWICCLLASSSYCCFTIVNLMMSYLSYGVLINMQVVEKTPLEFPAVTVNIFFGLLFF
jgi:hypothetical protein